MHHYTSSKGRMSPVDLRATQNFRINPLIKQWISIKIAFYVICSSIVYVRMFWLCQISVPGTVLFCTEYILFIPTHPPLCHSCPGRSPALIGNFAIWFCIISTYGGDLWFYSLYFWLSIFSFGNKNYFWYFICFSPSIVNMIDTEWNFTFLWTFLKFL